MGIFHFMSPQSSKAMIFPMFSMLFQQINMTNGHVFKCLWFNKYDGDPPFLFFQCVPYILNMLGTKFCSLIMGNSELPHFPLKIQNI